MPLVGVLIGRRCKINKIPQIGESTTTFLFVNKFNMDKKNITIEFIGDDENIKKIDKVFELII